MFLKLFFHWFALSFQKITYGVAKTVDFLSHFLSNSLLNQKQKLALYFRTMMTVRHRVFAYTIERKPMHKP